MDNAMDNAMDNTIQSTATKIKQAWKMLFDHECPADDQLALWLFCYGVKDVERAVIQAAKKSRKLKAHGEIMDERYVVRYITAVLSKLEMTKKETAA
jgi:hypothetical protein